MQISFWEQRWEENQIGFHLPEVNPYLMTYQPQFKLQEGARVLVPLCGKSLDMIWLAQQGYGVLGVECSTRAIQAFIEEQGLNAEQELSEHYTLHKSGAIHLLEGDFFQLQSSHLEDISLVYDRASLVALPAAMRQQYVTLLRQQLPVSARILLVTLEYDQAKMPGPPFSVSDEEVRQLYDGFKVELLHEQNIIEHQPRFRERGLEYMQERVYRISR